MATTLKTTFLLKRGTLANWTSKNPVLQKGEPGFVEDKNILKIGDGVTAFNDLKPIIPEWAQADEKPTYQASEIEGLSDFVSGSINDTDTQYQIVKVDDNNYKLQSKPIGGSWADVTDSTIAIPQYDDTELAEKVTNIEKELGILSGGGGDGETTQTIPEKIDQAKDEANQYTDNQLKTITLAKKPTPNEGYAASYELKIGTTAAGEVDIPKDYLVKSGDVKVVATANAPYDGAVVGEKYIDFVVNSVDGTGNESHIYIPLKDIGADAYVAGNGIEISDNNTIAVKVSESGSNGLAATENGLALGLASADASGAMSAETFSLVQQLSESISKVEASETNGNIKINDQEVTVYTLPDDVLRASDTYIFDGGEA